MAGRLRLRRFHSQCIDGDAVEKYITNQEEHHRRKHFQGEYVEMLRKSGVEYDEKYLW
jgi:hypothetical protein